MQTHARHYNTKCYEGLQSSGMSRISAHKKFLKKQIHPPSSRHYRDKTASNRELTCKRTVKCKHNAWGSHKWGTHANKSLGASGLKKEHKHILGKPQLGAHMPRIRAYSEQPSSEHFWRHTIEDTRIFLQNWCNK